MCVRAPLPLVSAVGIVTLRGSEMGVGGQWASPSLNQASGAIDLNTLCVSSEEATGIGL